MLRGCRITSSGYSSRRGGPATAKIETREGVYGPGGLELAQLCARVADDKKASDIVVLDVEKVFGITDYFVIMTGRSGRHIRMLADEIVHEARRQGVRQIRREVRGSARWALADLGTVVVHVFESEARRFYDLELLWGDAPRVDWD